MNLEWIECSITLIMIVDTLHLFLSPQRTFFVARIGATVDVFGLVTPLDHPPETTQWVTAWAGGLYILYIYRRD